jgi:hypothetical protein
MVAGEDIAEKVLGSGSDGSWRLESEESRGGLCFFAQVVPGAQPHSPLRQVH